MGGVKLVIVFYIVCCVFAGVSCTCGKGLWYDTNSNKCIPCTKCGLNNFVVTPCDNYRDTICASLRDLNFNFLKVPMEDVRPTHEIEFQGVNNWAPSYGNQESIIQTEINEKGLEAGNPVILGLAIGCVVAVVFVLIVLVVMSCRFKRRRNENRHSQTRARLFSRDRLNTTEYKHTLAFLDRKLAMDEILEKKRAALVPSGESRGNQYIDDVFVDLNTVPMEDARLLRNM